MKKRWIFILTVLLSVSVSGPMPGCSHNQETLTWEETIRDIRNKYPDVKQLRTDELYSWLNDSKVKPVIIIDARAEEEFLVSHIPAARNLPHNKELLNHLADINPDTPIVAYCSVGYRSCVLAKRLQDLGYTRVYNLEGSIFKWANEGRPLAQKLTTVHRVHPYDSHWGSLLEKKYH